MIDETGKILLLTRILRRRRRKRRYYLWNTFKTSILRARREGHGKLYRLVHELKIGLCCKDKCIYVPPQQEFFVLQRQQIFFHIFQKVNVNED